MQPSVLKPALISGVALGVVAAVPVVGSCLNICCCGLGALAGLVTALLLLSETPLTPKAPYGQGALAGFLTGAIGSVTYVLLASLANLVMGLAGLRPKISNMDSIFEDADMPPVLADMVQAMIPGAGLSLAWVFGALLFSFIAYAGSGTIGAVVGVAMFHQKRPPAEGFEA